MEGDKCYIHDKEGCLNLDLNNVIVRPLHELSGCNRNAF